MGLALTLVTVVLANVYTLHLRLQTENLRRHTEAMDWYLADMTTVLGIGKQ